jgi:endonuclease-3
MTTPNRTALIAKTHKALKKRYHPQLVRGEQPLLESLLFACCLENTPYQSASQVYGTVKSSFFDWNEVRVSTVKELAEVMASLPQAADAAANLKSILQSVFESDYSFDLESLKKQNIGQAVKRLQKLEGTTLFSVAYATQNALGGHAIPLDQGTRGAFAVLGLISQAEADSGNVAGLERAVPKSKGQEFSALIHEMGAQYFANPFAPAVRELLLSIAPDGKDRMPKRGAKKPVVEPPRNEPAADKKKNVEPAAVAAKKKESPTAKKSSNHHKAAPGPVKKKPAAAKARPAAKPLAKRKPR